MGRRYNGHVAGAQRLVIAAPPGASKDEPPAAWGQAAKLALLLDERDAKRLWAKLPVTLTLPPLDDALLADVLRRLQKGGAVASATEHRFKAPRCDVHRRAAADEVCPRCNERRACALCLATNEPPLCGRCSGRKRFFTTFRNVRVAILLGVLAVVSLVTWNDNRRITSWRKPLAVTIVPVDTTSDPLVASWIATLDVSRFRGVEEFFTREANRHGLPLTKVVTLSLAKPTKEIPPAEPDDLTNRLQIAAWSLKLRWWSWNQRRTHSFPAGDVTIYVLYEKDEGQIPEESLGIKQGRIGIVRTLAGERESGWTTVTVAHELLHTVGATDKYQPNGQPVFPDGWAEPKRVPQVPQLFAEVMAGQIPLDADGAFVQARSLEKCVIGRKTAGEIGWTRAGN